MKRLAPVFLWLAGLAACIVVIAQTRFTADMSAFLPQRPTAEQALLVDQLREGTLSRLLLVGIEGGDEASRARLSNALAARLSASPEFAGVQNGGAAALARDRALLFDNRYLLSPMVTPARFTADGLRQAIAESIDMLASPAGMMVKSLLPRDPTGEMLAIVGALGGDQGPAVRHGVWMSRDGSRALLMAQTAAPGSDTDGQERALERLAAEFAALPGAGEARLLVAGTPAFSVDARATIRGEVERLALIAAAGIVVVLALAYRSATALALGLLPVVSGALAGIAAVGLVFGHVHGLTIGFGTTLIGEAVDYSIYYFVQSRGRVDDEWQVRFWPTIRLGVLTSLIGFASLLFSGFPGLSQLGLYSMSGLLVAAAVTRFVLPRLCPSGFALRDTRAIGLAAAPVLARLPQLRWLAFALAAASLVVLAGKREGLWHARLSELSPMSARLVEIDTLLRGELGAPGQGHLVVVGGADREVALVAAERVANRLQELVDAGVLAGFETPTRFLPSAATQETRRAALPGREELEARLAAATAGLPIRAEKLAPFVADVEAAKVRPLLTAEALQGSDLGIAVASMLIERASGVAVLMPLRAPEGGAIDAPRVRTALAGERAATFLDVGAESNRLYGDYLAEAIWASLAGFVAIAVLLAASLRSVQRTARVLAPLVIAVLVVMAMLVFAGGHLTLLHLVGLLLTIAVGSNYALFFDRPDAALEPRTVSSVLIANATTVIGFGALATSSVPVLQAIGVTVGPGAVLALLFSAMLVQPKER